MLNPFYCETEPDYYKLYRLFHQDIVFSHKFTLQPFTTTISRANFIKLQLVDKQLVALHCEQAKPKDHKQLHAYIPYEYIVSQEALPPALAAGFM